MMDKLPQERYQTPVEVADALTPFARGETGPALIEERRTPPADEENEGPWNVQKITDDWAGSRSVIVSRTRGSTQAMSAEPREGEAPAEPFRQQLVRTRRPGTR